MLTMLTLFPAVLIMLTIEAIRSISPLLSVSSGTAAIGVA
jgi:hypothetical protein